MLMSVVHLKAQESFNGIYQEYLNGEATRSQTIDRLIQFLEHDHEHDDHDISKCLTPLMILMESERQETNKPIPLLLKAHLNNQASSAAEFISPSGKFRINYATAGRDTVPSDDFNNNLIPDYVEEVAAAADSSYNHEILTLGFTDPIGPGEVYDVFLEDLSNFGAYGLTNNRTTGSFPCKYR